MAAISISVLATHLRLETPGLQGAEVPAAHARVQGPPSVTVLLYGETFRIGQQGTRYTETPESIQPQLNATASQMENLILPLKRSGFRVTCFVGTNASEAGLEMLQESYKECMPTELGWKGVRNVVDGKRRVNFDLRPSDTFESSIDVYPGDYFILMRPDLILKQNLFDFWNNTKDSVAFPFMEACSDCNYKQRKCCSGKCSFPDCTRVADRLVALPRRALRFVQRNDIKVNDGMLQRLRGSDFSKVEKINITFWLNEGHNSNTEKDANPLYNIAGRKVAQREL